MHSARSIAQDGHPCILLLPPRQEVSPELDQPPAANTSGQTLPMQRLTAAWRHVGRSCQQLAAVRDAEGESEPLLSTPAAELLLRCKGAHTRLPCMPHVCRCSGVRRGSRVQRRRCGPCGGGSGRAAAAAALCLQEAGRLHAEHQGLQPQVPGRQAVWRAAVHPRQHHHAAARHRVPSGRQRGHGAQAPLPALHAHC